MDIQKQVKAQFPISTLDLQEWVPHRPPMVWIDEVIHVTESSAQCRVFLNPKAHYMSEGRIRQSSYVEWLAQSFAFFRASQFKLGMTPYSLKPERMFLVGIREAHFFSAESPETEDHFPSSLIVDVRNAREFGPLTLFEGAVFSELNSKLNKDRVKKNILFEAKIKVYSA